MEKQGSLEKWLVRTEANCISGPFSREKLQEMILQGSLSLQDEVCRGNSYWIYLHEASEILAQLGVRVPRPVVGGSDEDTQTETETLEPPRKIEENQILTGLEQQEKIHYWHGLILALGVLVIAFLLAMVWILRV